LHLRDKVVVVTGGGNGIGEACVRRFSAEGAKVVLADHPVMSVAWSPEAVADLLVTAIGEERFLIHTHPDAGISALVAKGQDYDSWIDSMNPARRGGSRPGNQKGGWL